LTSDAAAAASSPVSLEDCQKLAASLIRADELPVQCRKNYPELVRTILERRNSRQTGVDPFEGMWVGSALSARQARSQGKEYHAQIQRRMTSTKR
jgi:hypothetical protein